MRSDPRNLNLQAIRSLCKTVEESRLRPVSKNEDSNSTGSAGLEKDVSAVPGMATDTQDNKVDEIINPTPSMRSPNFEELADAFGMITTSPMIQATFNRPSNPPVAQLPSTSLPFALRFRHEALKRGYQLVTSQETYLSLLFRAFKRSIFSESRQSIIWRLHYLLHQSTKFIFQSAPAGNKDVFTNPLNLENFRRPLQTFDSPSNFTVDSKAYHLMPTTELGKNEISSDKGDGYIDAEDVEQYLLDRGLIIQTGSNELILAASPNQQNSASSTLFDEIRGGQELRLSVSKLLYGKYKSPNQRNE
jgi:hypothetical protein